MFIADQKSRRQCNTRKKAKGIVKSKNVYYNYFLLLKKSWRKTIGLKVEILSIVHQFYGSEILFCDVGVTSYYFDFIASFLIIISRVHKAFESPHFLFSAASLSRFMTTLATRFSVEEVVTRLLADSRLNFPLATGVA